MVLSIVGTVPSPVNSLIDTVPHHVIPQYENVDMIIIYTQIYYNYDLLEW